MIFDNNNNSNNNNNNNNNNDDDDDDYYNIIPCSPNDNRKTSTYELKNGLRVYIIEDDKINTSCVSMMVKIGHFYDYISGMAHFLEHMLFNGTKKYPDEKQFTEFVSKNSGSYNAFTTHNQTCYYYTISEDGLFESMDMFCDFFVSPLIKNDCVKREMNAVDSEHKKNVGDDNWRSHELLRVASQHPLFTKFGTGTTETLNDPNITDHLKYFFNKYYSSDVMTLIVITNKRTKNIKKMIDENYINITKKNANDFDHHPNTKILQTPTLIKYVPIENQNNMTIVWEIPSFHTNLDSSPISFICFLIGNEYKESIYHILSDATYVTEFECGQRESIHNKCLFQIEMTLTTYGAKHKKIIINTILKYIHKLLQNINSDHIKQLYNDFIDLTNHKFKYFEKPDNSFMIYYLSNLLSNYIIDPENILINEIMRIPYNDVMIENMYNVLNILTLDNAVMMYGSKKYDNDDKMLLFPNYQIKYKLMHKKMKCGDDCEYFECELPAKNPYISISDTDKYINTVLRPISPNGHNNVIIYPNIKFNVPVVSIILKITIPLALYHPLINTCVLLYLNSMLTELNHEIYMCSSAMYNLRFDYAMDNIYFNFEGNREKITDVYLNILSKMMDPNTITSDSFNTVKHNIMQKDLNSLFDQPYEKIERIFNKLLSKYYYDPKDRLKILSQITLESCKDVFKKVFSKRKSILFITGNCDNSCVNTIINNTPIKNTTEKNTKKYITPNKNIVHEELNDNESEDNVAACTNILIGVLNNSNPNETYKTFCLINLLDNLIGHDYFDELRTKETFGYIVNGKIIYINDNHEKIVYYSFTVQSPNKTTDEIVKRTDKFIKDYQKKINQITDFESMKKSFSKAIDNPEINLNEMTNFIFSNEIEMNNSNYDFKKSIIHACNNITQHDIVQFYNDKFINARTSITIKLNKKKKITLTGGCISKYPHNHINNGICGCTRNHNYKNKSYHVIN